MPALSLIAEPGRRRAALDAAREIERRGFAGISVSSSFGNISQSVGLALATERIPFATAIAPIYAQSVDEFAQTCAYLHEVSHGRFQFGIGIAHAQAYARMEVEPGRPLGDIRAFVEKFKSRTEYGPLPPVVLATLRKRMVALSAEIAEGLVFANASRAHMTESLSALPAVKRSDPDFFIGNRIRTCELTHTHSSTAPQSRRSSWWGSRCRRSVRAVDPTQTCRRVTTPRTQRL